ncbi:hypothetical protein B0A48_09895 [Cryoendolithus antarcticus]|uniref:Uncharacterized protein n=1 Tax=Cryoendolithus antarcticus TaxID=1507870 RepID=A0A1V8T385_9PEZI|nr:hypothetical protein B0A48_09895 [Cryoendolithus antarcticus]OQO26753.1 hypothetical protein B0A51_05637 [Rachicladosporium sp. CCFEE 5018]
MSTALLNGSFRSLARRSRTFTTTKPCFAGLPTSQSPSGASGAGKAQHDSSDSQSSASTVEHLTGDDHPAKQPDTQPATDRSTGINESKGEITGGKEGLGNRSDRKSEGSEK